MFNKQLIAYVKEEDVLLGVKSINVIEQTIELQDLESNSYEFKISEVEILEELGECDGVTIFNRDVFEQKEGSLIELVLQKDGRGILYVLNEKLERGISGSTFDIEKNLSSICEKAKLVGNIHELEPDIEESKLDFNIKTVKNYNGEYYTYFYACNNKEKEEIDLIKVVFIGHNLIEEEIYERKTVSHIEFLTEIEDKTLAEVSEQEFKNYAYGMLSGHGFNPEEEDATEEDTTEEECEDDICFGCYEEEEDCTCNPW